MRQRQDQAGPGGLPGALSPRMRDGAGSPHTRGRATPGALLSRALASPVRLLMALLAVLLLAAGAWQFLGRAPGPARDARSRSSMGLAAHLRGAPSPAFCARPRPTLVCAHGGDSTDHPANTAEAFSAAVRGGADCVEVDAARTADGELFVLHVRELKQLLDHAGPRRVYQLLGDALSARHIADSSLQIGDLTYKQVSALHWPGGERVMTVREAVKATMFHVESITLDVKTYQGEGGLPTDEDAISEQLVRLVHETGCTNCLIWAKSDRVVQTIKALSPGQRTGYIVMNETVAARSERMHEPLRMEGPEVVGMHHGMVDAYHVDLLRRAGKQLHTWTINDPALLRQVLDEGVDALVTNFPRQAIEAIETLLEACGKTGEAYYSL